MERAAERAAKALGVLEKRAPRGGGEEHFTIELDAVRVLETYLPGGARLIPLIYAREAAVRGGVRIVLPHRYSLDKIYMDSETAEKLYDEAMRVAGETLGGCREGACSSMALDYVARVLAGQGPAGGSGAYTRTVSYKDFWGAVASDVERGYTPIFVMMTVNIRHIVVLLHLRLIYMLMHRVNGSLASRGLRARPCFTVLLWPLRDPSEDVAIKPELDDLFGDRYAAVMVDPDRYAGDWRLFDFVAEAHKVYFSRGATAPHNVLTNMVMEEIGEYTSAQRRAYTLAHALARGLGFPYNFTLPQEGMGYGGSDGLRLVEGGCLPDGSRPVYIYVGGMTYYATLRLMLEALALAHPRLSRSLGLSLHERLAKIAESIQAWKAGDYSFRVYLVEFKRMVYAWEVVSSLRNLAYEALMGRASSKRRRPGRLARDREALARAAAEAYKLLSSSELEGYMNALKRLARSFPRPEDEVAAVIVPLVLRRAALGLRDTLAPALAVLRSGGDPMDIITCRNILEGLNMLYDMLALYILTYPFLLQEAGIVTGESHKLPARIVMPMLDVADARYESAFFRSCKDALIGLLERTNFLERYADLAGSLARAALKRVVSTVERLRGAAKVEAALEVMGMVSGMLESYLPQKAAKEEVRLLSGILYELLKER